MLGAELQIGKLITFFYLEDPSFNSCQIQILPNIYIGYAFCQLSKLKGE